MSEHLAALAAALRGLLDGASEPSIVGPALGVTLALIGLAGCAFCGGFETGVYTLNRVRLAVRATRGDLAAQLLREELLHPNRLIATCLLGNNLSHNLLSFGVAAILVPYAFSDSQEVTVNTLIVLPSVLLLGEVLPKDLFRAFSDPLAYLAARPFRVLRALLTWSGLVPAVRAVGELPGLLLGLGRTPQATSRQRISQLLQEGAGAGLLTEEQLALADRALALGMRSIDSQMVQWRKAVTIPSNAEHSQVMAILQASSYSRYPVTSPSGAVEGVLEARDALLNPDQLPSKLARHPLMVKGETPVTKVLLRMRSERTAMAMVVDDRGAVVGFATMRDLLQPMLGQLPGW